MPADPSILSSPDSPSIVSLPVPPVIFSLPPRPNTQPPSLLLRMTVSLPLPPLTDSTSIRVSVPPWPSLAMPVSRLTMTLPAPSSYRARIDAGTTIQGIAARAASHQIGAATTGQGIISFKAAQVIVPRVAHDEIGQAVAIDRDR